MKSKNFESVEALYSIITESELKLFEVKALSRYFTKLETDMEYRLNEENRQHQLKLFKDYLLKWKIWILQATNAYENNMHFYKNRLNAILED